MPHFTRIQKLIEILQDIADTGVTPRLPQYFSIQEYEELQKEAMLHFEDDLIYLHGKAGVHWFQITPNYTDLVDNYKLSACGVINHDYAQSDTRQDYLPFDAI